jgi:hypothetical protein
MAAKKTVTKKAKSKTPRKRAPTSAPLRQYRCPNPGRPMNLATIVRKLLKEPGFAKFIHDLLCRANKGDAKAEACLKSYFEPQAGELQAICYTRSMRAKYLQCTEQNRLLDVVAYYGAGGTDRR